MHRGRSRPWLGTIRGLADFAVISCGEAYSAATAGWEIARGLNFMKNGDVCVTLVPAAAGMAKRC